MFEEFIAAMRSEVEEFLSTGKMQRAIELTRQTNQHFNANQFPMYFTGNLESKLVAVDHNPKQPNNGEPSYLRRAQISDFDEYFRFHTKFGSIQYSSTAAHKHYSVFDNKQVQFFEGFGGIEFVSGARCQKLQQVIDDKLQLELIPYGSETFNRVGFTETILRPHMGRILNVIGAMPRNYVLFRGKIFESFLRQYIVVGTREKFPLPMNDGGVSRGTASFSILRIPHGETQITAGLAPTYAKLGINSREYGKKCKELYDKYKRQSGG